MKTVLGLFLTLSLLSSNSFANPIEDRVVLDCSNASVEIQVHPNTDAESASLYAFLVLLLQKQGGVPLVVPTNVKKNSQDTIYFNTKLDFALTVNGSNGNLHVDNDGNQAVSCQAPSN